MFHVNAVEFAGLGTGKRSKRPPLPSDAQTIELKELAIKGRNSEKDALVLCRLASVDCATLFGWFFGDLSRWRRVHLSSLRSSFPAGDRPLP